MSDNKYYYFDANVLYKHYVSEKAETGIRRLSTTATVYVSNLAYLEVLGVFMRHYRQERLGKHKVRSLVKRLKRDIGPTPDYRFRLVTTQEGIFRYARALMTEYAMIYELSTNDALHIAIAKIHSPPLIMVTSDGGKGSGKMKGVCAKIGLEILDPER